MPARHDLECADCHERIADFIFISAADAARPLKHWPCGGALDIVFSGAPVHQPWHPSDAIVVFKDKDGNVRYPGRNDVPTPDGFERVTMRSLREVERFEREHNVRSEVAWFDKGSGRGSEREF